MLLSLVTWYCQLLHVSVGRNMVLHELYHVIVIYDLLLLFEMLLSAVTWYCWLKHECWQEHVVVDYTVLLPVITCCHSLSGSTILCFTCNPSLYLAGGGAYQKKGVSIGAKSSGFRMRLPWVITGLLHGNLCFPLTVRHVGQLHFTTGLPQVSTYLTWKKLES